MGKCLNYFSKRVEITGRPWIFQSRQFELIVRKKSSKWEKQIILSNRSVRNLKRVQQGSTKVAIFVLLVSSKGKANASLPRNQGTHHQDQDCDLGAPFSPYHLPMVKDTSASRLVAWITTRGAIVTLTVGEVFQPHRTSYRPPYAVRRYSSTGHLSHWMHET